MAPREAPSSPVLTPRQLDCMALVEKGLTSKQIGRELGISSRTVEQHIASALDTLDANNRLAGVARWRELRQTELAVAEGGGRFMLATRATPVEQAVVVRHDRDALLDHIENEPIETGPLLPSLGGRMNKASRETRNAWILRIAAGGIMLSAVVILSIIGLFDMAERVQ